MRIEDTGNCLTDQDDKIETKILEIDPGESLDFRTYNEKDEHWHVLEGTCIVKTVYLETTEKRQLNKDEQYYIGRKVKHSASNPGDNTCRILKVIYGEDNDNE